MQIDANNRTVVVENKSLTDPEMAHSSAVTLLSVMLYPEHPEKHDLYHLGMQRNILNIYCSPDEKKVILQGNPDLAVAYALDDRGLALDTLNKTLHSREKGLTGSLAVRGSIAGHLLCILAKPHIVSLEDTYKIYRDNFQPEYGVHLPSRKLLQNIWREFKHVSHLWAAAALFKEEYDKILFQGIANARHPTPHPQAAVQFGMFLQIASFFRIQLIKLVKISTHQPHIKDPFNVWNIIKENGKPLPAMKLSLKKNQ